MPIALPQGMDAVEAGASLAIVIGRTATRVPAVRARGFRRGLRDRQRRLRTARQRLSPGGPAALSRWLLRRSGRACSSQARTAAPDALRIRVFVNGRIAAENTTANLVRPIAQLIADVTEFMTLSPGDLLLSGVPDGMPLLRDAGDACGSRSTASARWKILWCARRAHEARPRRVRGRRSTTRRRSTAGVRLADGRTFAETDVVYLPPLPPTQRARTIFALGLNYADHAKELAFKAPDEPLVFLKAPNTLLGHRAVTRRPADATHMHYECELAVVIGRTARNVTARAGVRLHCRATRWPTIMRSATISRTTIARTCA